MGMCCAPGIISRIFSDQTRWVGRICCASMTDDATIQLPGRKCGASPPATPKLMMLRDPLLMAWSSDEATSLSVLRQITTTPGPDAMRASKANPTRAMTRRSAGAHSTSKQSGSAGPVMSLLAEGIAHGIVRAPAIGRPMNLSICFAPLGPLDQLYL